MLFCLDTLDYFDWNLSIHHPETDFLHLFSGCNFSVMTLESFPACCFELVLFLNVL
jgi:hypothetical protein